MSEQPFDTASAAISQRVAVGLIKVGLALRHRDWREAAEWGITPTQGQILSLLQQRGDGGLRLTHLAEELAMTPPTVSDAVAALVRKGLVQKLRAADDGRAVRIILTREGTEVAAQFGDWADLLLAGVDALSPDEQRVLLRSLVKMIRMLQLQGRIPIARMCVTCQFFRPHVYPGSDEPHHCAFVGAPFGDRQLQIDCPDHRLSSPEHLDDLWNRFVSGGESESSTASKKTVT